MISSIKSILNHPLFSGSAMMIIGSNATNALNYIYHFIMGRLLGPSNYGELAALFSLIGLLGIIPLSLGLVAVKYISSAKSDDEVSGLIKWIVSKVTRFSLVLFIALMLISPLIASFLSTNVFFVFLVIVSFAITIPTYFNKSILQGLLGFDKMVIANLIENIIKLALGVYLVYLGYSVGGALFALVISGITGLVLTRKFIKKHLNKNAISHPKVKPMLIYSIPILLQSFANTSLYSTDLVLVKHYFPPHEVGIYAALSTLGKIIFFGAGPIGVVMFPLIASRHAKGNSFNRVFNYSLIATLLLSGGVLMIYWFFPKIAILLLYGSSYLERADLLVWFGLFMSLFTISSLYINFHLSLNRVKVVIFPLAAAIGQLLGIYFYHSSLKEVILVSVITSFILLISLVIYSLYGDKISIRNRPSL